LILLFALAFVFVFFGKIPRVLQSSTALVVSGFCFSLSCFWSLGFGVGVRDFLSALIFLVCLFARGGGPHGGKLVNGVRSDT
jgi:hypothetical protein